MSADMVLAKINGAREFLAKANSLQEVHQVVAMAEAVRVYGARVHASKSAMNDAAEIQLRAQRRLGELLQRAPKAHFREPDWEPVCVEAQP